MRLPIRNKSTRTLAIFIEPFCDRYEVPIGGEAMVYLEDGKPHSIEVHDAGVTIWDEGAEATVEVISERENAIVEALRLAHAWLHNLGARAAAATMNESLDALEKSEGYLGAHAKVFAAFHKGFQIWDAEASPGSDKLPAWSGHKHLAGSYRAGGAAAYLNSAQRSRADFPGMGVGPFDTETVRKAFAIAALVIAELEKR